MIDGVLSPIQLSSDHGLAQDYEPHNIICYYELVPRWRLSLYSDDSPWTIRMINSVLGPTELIAYHKLAQDYEPHNIMRYHAQVQFSRLSTYSDASSRTIGV